MSPKFYIAKMVELHSGCYCSRIEGLPQAVGPRHDGLGCPLALREVWASKSFLSQPADPGYKIKTECHHPQPRNYLGPLWAENKAHFDKNSDPHSDQSSG